MVDDEATVKAKRRRRTPIEMWIEDRSIDRRTAYDLRQKEKGITRILVRVHVDDVARLKKFANALLAGRGLGK